MKREDELDGANAALSCLVIALVEAMPDKVRDQVWERFVGGVEAARVAMLNDDWSDATIEGFDRQIAALKATRAPA